LNTSKKQNAKKERMSEEICSAKKFVYCLYPGHEETYEEYTIECLTTNDEKSTIFLEVSNLKGTTQYTLNHVNDFLDRKNGPYCSYNNGTISFFSNQSKQEYEKELEIYQQENQQKTI